MTVDSVLEKISNNTPLTREDSLTILQIRAPDAVELLFKSARQTREKFFGNELFLYGFIYTSTFCRNNCSFCFYRKENKLSPRFRYRKGEEEILEASLKLAQSGAHLIDLTMAEDPMMYKDCDFKPLMTLVKRVKECTGLPVMISPGVVPADVLKQLAEAGADWFACYQETHNRDLFSKLRPQQDFELRFHGKTLAHDYGMLTEEGILVGAGETEKDIVDSLEIMSTSGADQVRAMNFVPQQGTPMQQSFTVGTAPQLELIIIALMRLLFPDRLIPATLDVEGLAGLKKRLDAGANVVTSIVPPSHGLAGVAQSSLDIDDARRTTENVIQVLNQCNLNVAPLENYISWCNTRKSRR